MLSLKCVLLLYTVWVFQCSASLKNRTILVVKKNNNEIVLQPKLYVAKPNEIIIGRGKYTDQINSTGYV